MFRGSRVSTRLVRVPVFSSLSSSEGFCRAWGLERRDLGCRASGFSNLGAEYPSPQKRLTHELIVGFYKPQRVKGYLLSHPKP